MPHWPVPTRTRPLDLSELAQADVTERWRYYEQLAAMQRTVPEVASDVEPDVDSDAGYRYDEEVK